jgi:hypothetical protein
MTIQNPARNIGYIRILLFNSLTDSNQIWCMIQVFNPLTDSNQIWCNDYSDPGEKHRLHKNFTL